MESQENYGQKKLKGTLSSKDASSLKNARVEWDKATSAQGSRAKS